MKKKLFIFTLGILLFIFAGYTLSLKQNINESSTPTDNGISGTQNSKTEPLKSIAQCKENLEIFNIHDKDTCYGINATETKNPDLCGKISDETRKGLCYMRLSKEANNPELCNKNNIGSIKIQAACLDYNNKASNSIDDIEKNILVTQIENKMKQKINDIETQLIKEDISDSKLQQEIDALQQIGREKFSL